LKANKYVVIPKETSRFYATKSKTILTQKTFIGQ